MQGTIVSCLCCCIRNRGSRGRTLCGGGFRLGSLIFKPGRTGHRGDQHSAVDAERQQHASGQISGFFGCGALAKAAVGNQQEQCCQRQVNQFGRCQQDAEHRQRSHSRTGSTVPSLQPKIACMHSAVKANASPSSRESRLKEAARCSVMGSRPPQRIPACQTARL